MLKTAVINGIIDPVNYRLISIFFFHFGTQLTHAKRIEIGLLLSPLQFGFRCSFLAQNAILFGFESVQHGIDWVTKL